MNFVTELEKFGSQKAIISDQGEILSYVELASLADSVFIESGAPVASALVAIECENSVAYIAAYLGALRARIPVLLVDADLEPSLRDKLYSHYGVTHIYRGNSWLVYSSLPVHVNPNVALLLSTSGTTGSQKLVKLSQRNLHSNAISIAQYLALSMTERPITILPMHYSYGLSVLNSHIAVGATILLTAEPVTSKLFWEHFRVHGATSFAGVPATYKILRQLRFERMTLPSLKYFTQAGGKLAPEFVDWFNNIAQKNDQRFVVMYGQTEATARIAFVPPEYLAKKAASIGIAIPGGELSLVDDAGETITVSHVTGELCYRGDNVMLGYATDISSLAEADSQNGFLRTGDLAWRDDDGYYYIAGRLKRFIKVFGNKIGLDEVENHLHSDGYDVAVTGEDDALMIAVLSDCNDMSLKNDIANRYRLHPSAISVFKVEHFPMSSSGKILYADLLAQLTSRKG